MAEDTKQHFYQSWWFVLIVLILGIGIFGNIVNHLEKEQPVRAEAANSPFYKKMAKEELKEKMARPDKTPEVIVAEIIMQNFGTTNVEKENAVISSRFESGVVETIALETQIKSADSARRSFLNSTVDMMKSMKSQENVTQATLIIQAPLSDQYGHIENGDVMIIVMSRETLNKINFTHFKAENLSAVADSYWEHPALSGK